MPINPNPEGLPSLKLPGGYYLKHWPVEDAYLLYKPNGESVLDDGGDALTPETAQAFAAAMNAHTDALGAALEEIAQQPLSSEANAKSVELVREYGDFESAYDQCVRVARAAVEAWRSGR